MSRAALLAFAACAITVGGCPVGCPPPKDGLSQIVGPEVVALREVSRCRYAPERGLPGEYPRSDAGFYGVDVNGFPNTSLSEPFAVDRATGTLILQEPWCSQPTHDVLLTYYRWVRTQH